MGNPNPSPATRIKPGEVRNPNGRRNNGLAKLLDMVRVELGHDTTQKKVKDWIANLTAEKLWRLVVLPLMPKESSIKLESLTPKEAKVIFVEEARRLESGGGVEEAGAASIPE